MLLQGWIPVERIDEIKHFLETEEVYYEISDPSPEDDVPILLNNKGFFRLFEPIMRLYMLPKYNELDLTPFFAPFFMLFSDYVWVTPDMDCLCFLLLRYIVW